MRAEPRQDLGSAPSAERIAAHVPLRIRKMTVSDLACVVIGVQEAVEAFDAMRDRPTDTRVADFKTKMNHLRALTGLGSDPVESVVGDES